MTVTFSFNNREYFCNTKISSDLKSAIEIGTPIFVKFNKEDPLENVIFPIKRKNSMDLDSTSILGTVIAVEEYSTNSIFKGRSKFREVYFSYVNNDSIYSNVMVFDLDYKIGINDIYYLGKYKNINILDIRRKY